MFKKMVVVMILAVSLIFSQSVVDSTQNDKPDFRNVFWGQPKADIIKSEKNSNITFVDSNKNVIIYDGKIAGLSTKIAYIFVQNKLVRAKYVFEESHTNDNDYIADYDNIKGILIEKYSNPTEDTHYWKNDLYRDDFTQWGFAVSLGHTSYFTDWETEKSSILLSLLGDNYKIRHEVQYSSKELGELEKQENKKKELQSF
jgi:hypothetical protein